MATILVFSSESAAAAAEAVISTNIGYPIIGENAATGQEDAAAQETLRWAMPTHREDGSWFIPKPDAAYMAGISGYTEEEIIPMPPEA